VAGGAVEGFGQGDRPAVPDAGREARADRQVVARSPADTAHRQHHVFQVRGQPLHHRVAVVLGALAQGGKVFNQPGRADPAGDLEQVGTLILRTRRDSNP
jgi:hypothetical protein